MNNSLNFTSSNPIVKGEQSKINVILTPRSKDILKAAGEGHRGIRLKGSAYSTIIVALTDSSEEEFEKAIESLKWARKEV